MNKHRILIIFLNSFFITTILFLIGCKSPQKITAPKAEVGKGFLTTLPLNMKDFHQFVNLGHMSQPGHTFPSGHGGFYLTDFMARVPVFCPADMIITRIVESEHVNYGYTDYAMTLSVNQDEFQIVIGHMSGIHDSILEQAEAFIDRECEKYSTSGDSFNNCLLWTEISVSAGDTLGMAGGNPGQLGLDFGTYDKTRPIEFATNRFDGYLYSCAVSPLDYFTEEINQILIPICGDSFCQGKHTVRTKPPVGGTIDYDVPGTAQGIWLKAGEPMYPEDPHIALVYHNVDPDVSIFSIGISHAGLTSGPYTFASQDTGYVDRIFHGVKSDGHIYRYNVWYHCSTSPDMRAVLLLQLIDESHLKIEKQDTSSGPPWIFTENAVLYDR
jgi:hypothetical protein